MHIKSQTQRTQTQEHKDKRALHIQGSFFSGLHFILMLKLLPLTIHDPRLSSLHSEPCLTIESSLLKVSPLYHLSARLHSQPPWSWQSTEYQSIFPPLAFSRRLRYGNSNLSGYRSHRVGMGYQGNTILLAQEEEAEMGLSSQTSSILF